MSYKEKPILKLYKYENNTFVLQAIIDDYQECSFERNLYQAGNFTISINYNIPNAQLFQRGLFVQFGNDPYDFGEIISISDAISSDGKGSQIRTITGYDSRYILKRRVIKNMNSNGLWVMTGKGEIVLRNLINDQCGANAEEKRKLPITNTIPTSENAIGKEYSASEQFSNLYEVCKTIATQSEIGWRLEFNGTNLNLVCFEGTDRTQTVQFSTSFDSLANGEFIDSSESFSNAIYVGGKGQNDDRDIYEGESVIEGASPSGLDRFESWDNQSSMTTESEYEAEALSMLNQYGQTLTMSGNGLAKCPYEYEKEYFVGDKIKIAFSGKSANAQILSVTEHWAFGAYEINFNFGKPLPDLNAQLQLMLKQIQKASNKTNSKDSVRWYIIPDDTSMPASDVTYNTIGFIGNVGSGATFTLYRDSSGTGSKTYHVYFKQLAGAGKLTLTTGKEGASNLILNAGTYVAIVYVDENGNITSQGMTATSAVEAGNNQPVTSDGVYDGLAEKQDELTAGANISITDNEIEGVNDLPTDAVLHYSFDDVPDYPDGTADVRLLDNNTYDIQSVDYKFVDHGGSTFSNVNGNLTVSITGHIGNTGAILDYTKVQNKIIKIKLNVTAIVGSLDIYNGHPNLIKTINNVGKYEIVFFAVNNEQYPDIYFVCAGIGNSCTFTVEQIYIGDGSYSTPIIDNVNGQNNATNNGGIAIKGVSGKGAYFPSALQYMNIPVTNLPAPTSNDDFTISMWLKIDSGYVTNNEDTYKPICCVGRYAGAFGLCRHNTDIVMLARDSAVFETIESHIDVNKWHLYTGIFYGASHKFALYKDGEIIRYSRKANTPNYQFGDGLDWTLWSNSTISGNAPTTTAQGATIDDLLIFNSALTEKEVRALYNNKAQTPKYYSLADYSKQGKTLETPLTIGGTEYTTVEGALSAIVSQL